MNRVSYMHRRALDGDIYGVVTLAGVWRKLLPLPHEIAGLSYHAGVRCGSAHSECIGLLGRFERLCLRALAEGAISESRAAELLDVPVGELDSQWVPIA